LVGIEKGQMRFRLNNEKSTFNICRSMKKSGEVVIMNFESDDIEENGSLVAHKVMFGSNQRNLS